jgi:hypothetical protein
MNDSAMLYRLPLGLLTDLYQLTMAYGYWKLGRAEQQAVFHLFFRRAPFQGGYALAAGLAPALDFVEAFRIDASDAQYLQSLRGNDDSPLFEPEFLSYLAALRLTCDIDAMPEGTVALRPGAAPPGPRPASPVPASRNGSAHHRQLSNAHRHQGRADLRRRSGRAGHRVRLAAGPGNRRRVVRQPGRVHRGLCSDLQRASRQAVWHSRAGNARP